MGRPIGQDLFFADMEARRYVLSQVAYARQLDYPKQAAFAKHIARGTISLAPTPEDEILDRVGRFAWALTQIKREVLFLHYGDDRRPYEKAKGLGMSQHQFGRKLKEILWDLRGYLRACDDVGKKPTQPSAAAFG